VPEIALNVALNPVAVHVFVMEKTQNGVLDGHRMTSCWYI
jgi:hypothetical protein